MTDTQRTALNEQVAQAMGWEQRVSTDGYDYWFLPMCSLDVEGNLTDYRLSLPDFCRDVMAIGYLVGWLDMHTAWQVRRSEDGCRAVLRAINSPQQIFGPFCPKTSEAICRAIIAYTETQKEEHNDN